MKDVVCFHRPEEENGWCSNWYASAFTLRGSTYANIEQYMMAQKARLFGDEATAARILKTTDPAKIKALGRAVQPYDDRLWNGVRQLIVGQGLLAKFSQNPALEEKLLATGDALLAECAVRDRIWGIGLSMTDLRRLTPESWCGENLLGFALMWVRKELRARQP